MGACKAQLAQLNNQLQTARNNGQSDGWIKQQITKQQAIMESLKKDAGGDIDVVPLQEVDQEVQDRCAGLGHDVLEFALDTTMLRNEGGTGGNAAMVPPPKGNH